MAKYKKKPVVVEAVQWWKSDDYPEVVGYYRNPEDNPKRACEECGKEMHYHGWIDTLEGGHIVCPGDFVIKGVQGEFYPCKPEIFEKTYEPASKDDIDRYAKT